jgi:hypothetical protein
MEARQGIKQPCSMNSNLPPIGQMPAYKRTAKVFSVVGIHQVGADAQRMLAARDQLTRILGTEVHLNFFSWPFHKLEMPDIRAMAFHIAEESGMILIPGTGAEPVPDHVLRWLDSSLIAQRDRRALIVALEPDGNLCAFARQFASRWQTQHLCAQDLEQAHNRSFVAQAVQRHLEAVATEENANGQWIEANHTRPVPQVSRPAKPMPSLISKPGMREEVRMSAYRLWLAAGCPSGRELDFWLQAERDFLTQQFDESRSADC